MKQLNLIKGPSYLVEDSEAKNIENNLLHGVKFIKLRNGTLVNAHVIASVGDVETRKTYLGYDVLSDGRSFMRDGKRVFIDRAGWDLIEEVPVLEVKESFKKLK